MGTANIYKRSDGTWIAEETLTASNDESDYFGWNVAINGNTALVGAMRGMTAYVFTQSSDRWSEQTKLTANNGADKIGLIESVAIEGNTIVLGAEYDNAAYVFARDGEQWTQQAKFTPNNTAIGNGFGTSVALSGKTVIVGAPFDNAGTDAFYGSTYVFNRSGDNSDATAATADTIAQSKSNLSGTQSKQRQVEIYLIESNSNDPWGLSPLKRTVNDPAPLRPTLKALLAGPTFSEKEKGYGNIDFGVKLAKVGIKNGIVRVDLFMAPGAAFAGDMAPFMLEDAVIRTAKQFPQVKKVIVCLDGVENFGSESGDNSPRKCPKL
jgi:hypothetical protein